MKTKTSTPKYGLIYHSTFIGRAGRQFKGRASRFLSNKLSIASRIDAFSGNIKILNSILISLKGHNIVNLRSGSSDHVRLL